MNNPYRYGSSGFGQEALKQAYEQGKAAASQNYDIGVQQSLVNIRREFEEQLNRTAGGLRKDFQQRTAQYDQRFEQKLNELSNIAGALKVSRTGQQPGTLRIEDIPGRRVPFVMLVEIPIGANTVSVREASVTISQEGPFIAVRRMATFQSAYEFQVTDPDSGNIARFAGRSYGRYRPIHSAWDTCDSQHNALGNASSWYWEALAAGWTVGTPLPSATLGMASTMSSFRTMEFDGRISVINAGSSYPRQNISVPSSMWSPQINAPQDLGALDFFERGEVLTIQVQPTHVNNPPAGNVTGQYALPFGVASAGGVPGGDFWPFLDGQYDAHEGIATPSTSTVDVNNNSDPSPLIITSDKIQRLPDGILIIGWEGYRIIQPIGPVL